MSSVKARDHWQFYPCFDGWPPRIRQADLTQELQNKRKTANSLFPGTYVKERSKQENLSLVVITKYVGKQIAIRDGTESLNEETLGLLQVRVVPLFVSSSPKIELPVYSFTFTR